MDAIRISTRLDSDTLYLPQLQPLIGKTVEIIVQEQSAAPKLEQNSRNPHHAAWKAALAGLRELDIDWDAYKRQREYDIRSTNDRPQ